MLPSQFTHKGLTMTPEEIHKSEYRLAQFIMKYQPDGKGGWVEETDKGSIMIGEWHPYKDEDQALILWAKLCILGDMKIAITLGDFGMGELQAIATTQLEEDLELNAPGKNLQYAICKLAVKLLLHWQEQKNVKG